MNKAKKAFSMINNRSFDLQDISNMGDHALMVNGIFSDKISIEYVTSSGLPLRLKHASDSSYLPYPFVFTPSRKECLKNLLPQPKEFQTIIEGFSQTGKSNLACHLCLMYRMKPQNHAVMYIGNMSTFNANPLNFLKDESFYWFYEEIEKNLMAQIVMGYLVDIDQIEVIFKAIRFLSDLAKANGKISILIIDQYNKFLASEELVRSIMRYLLGISTKLIFVTTNTDNQITTYRSSDIILHKPLVLDERKKPLEKSEMTNVIKKLFNENDSFAETLFAETQGDLNLMFLFFNHCAEKMVLTKNGFNFYDEYKDFATNYSKENLKKHGDWISEKKIDEFPSKNGKLQEMMMFLDLDIAYGQVLDENLLDARYVFASNDGLIKSINHLISKILREKYWTFSLIEKFLNTYGHRLSGSSFGGVFEYYILAKMEAMNNKRTPIRIKIDGNAFFLGYAYKSYVRYGQNHADEKVQIPKSSKVNVKDEIPKFEILTFSNENIPKDQSVLYSTDQQNFPLCEFICHIPENDVAIFLNVRKKLGLGKKDIEKAQNYFQIYSEETKKKLGKNIFLNIN